LCSETSISERIRRALSRLVRQSEHNDVTGQEKVSKKINLKKMLVNEVRKSKGKWLQTQ